MMAREDRSVAGVWSAGLKNAAMAAKDLWTASKDNGLITLRGEIDYSVTPDVRTFLLGAVGETSGILKLDLGNVSYLDSSGLAVLIEARRVLMMDGRGLEVTDASPQVRKLFSLTQVGILFGM
jgi:anti-sigma B factor antagonist